MFPMVRALPRWGSIATMIRAHDPTAHFVAPNLFGTGSFLEFTPLDPPQWFEAFVQAYRQLYGQPPPIDAIGVHLYPPFGPFTNPDYTPEYAVSQHYEPSLQAFRGAADRNGYGGVPIWITEFGLTNCQAGEPTCKPDDPAAVAYATDLLARAVTLFHRRQNDYLIERWFVFDAAGYPGRTLGLPAEIPGSVHDGATAPTR